MITAQPSETEKNEDPKIKNLITATVRWHMYKKIKKIKSWTD